MVSWTVPPLRSGLGIELFDQAPTRGDFHAGRPAGAQRLLERLFEAFLADLHAGHEKQRVLVLRFIFLDIGGAHIADQLATVEPPGNNG